MKTNYQNTPEQHKQVAFIIQHLLDQLIDDNKRPLRDILTRFQTKLLSTPVEPLLLNRMVLEITGCLITYNILLSREESRLFKNLFKLI